MPTHVARPLFPILVIALSINPAVKGQQSSDSPSSSATAPKTSATAPSTSVKESRGPLSDYVPCLFSVSDDEQFDMRAQVAPKQPPQVLDVRAAQQLLAPWSGPTSIFWDFPSYRSEGIDNRHPNGSPALS
jgi:hypothetical protein